MNNPYTQDGVNVQAGDSFSAIVAKLTATTHNNCPYVEVLDLAKGNFRGPRPFLIKGLPLKRVLFDAGPDGVGTKASLHDILTSHQDAANDLLAMTCGDITRFGGLPALFWNVLDARSLGNPGSEKFKLYLELINGLVKSGNEQGVIIHKGETAELGCCVGTDNPSPHAPFNWAGVAFGIFLQDKIIYGDRVKSGDVVIALKENGFRSNGISSVRKAFTMNYGPDYSILAEAKKDLIAAATPSVLYDRFLATANGWYEKNLHRLIDVHLIAHITGGGIGKFVELLAPTGLSANLDNLFELPEIMRKCADWRGMNDREVYTTWNGGQGVLAVVAKNHAKRFIELAKNFRIEARICGDIFESSKPMVRVDMKYNNKITIF